MKRSETSNALIREVAFPAAIALLMLSAIVVAILHFSTNQSDQLAAQSQNQRVKVAVTQGIIGIANDQEASTYWDEAVIQTRKRPLDLAWIRTMSRFMRCVGAAGYRQRRCGKPLRSLSWPETFGAS